MAKVLGMGRGVRRGHFTDEFPAHAGGVGGPPWKRNEGNLKKGGDAVTADVVIPPPQPTTMADLLAAAQEKAAEEAHK